MSNESPTTPLSAESILHGRLDQIISTLAGITGKVDTVVNGQVEQSVKIDRLDQRVSALEDAKRNDSLPVKVTQVTSNDAKQDAILAQHTEQLTALTTKVEGVETKVDDIGVDTKAIKTAVTGFLANPRVKAVGWIIFLLLSGYAAARGLVVPK